MADRELGERGPDETVPFLEEPTEEVGVAEEAAPEEPGAEGAPYSFRGAAAEALAEPEFTPPPPPEAEAAPDAEVAGAPAVDPMAKKLTQRYFLWGFGLLITPAILTNIAGFIILHIPFALEWLKKDKFFGKKLAKYTQLQKFAIFVIDVIVFVAIATIMGFFIVVVQYASELAGVDGRLLLGPILGPIVDAATK